LWFVRAWLRNSLVIATDTSQNCHHEISIEKGRNIGYREEWTGACEAEEFPLLEAVAKKRLATT
jgi:hypothetical protein